MIDTNDDELDNVSLISNEHEEDFQETNCLALTVQKDYHFQIIKNVVSTTSRMSMKVLLSTVILNFLRFIF